MKICPSEHPSTRAACSSSVGRSVKNARMKKVPNEMPVDASTRFAPSERVQQAHGPKLEVQRNHVGEEGHQQPEDHRVEDDRTTGER